jgi:hypothetical protein
MDTDENDIIYMDYESSQTDNPLNNGHENNEHWFCFDDSTVTSVTRQHIQRHFGQNDCAYMLFYRQKNRTISTMDCSDSEEVFFSKNRFNTNDFLDTLYSIPQWLLDEISEKNKNLEEKR